MAQIARRHHPPAFLTSPDAASLRVLPRRRLCYGPRTFRGVMQFDASGPPGATHAPLSYAHTGHNEEFHIHHLGYGLP